MDSKEKSMIIQTALLRGALEIVGWMTRDEKGWPGLVFWNHEEAMKLCKPSELTPIYVEVNNV